MTNIYEWLEGANQPLMAPPAPFLQPMDEVLVEDDPMDQITLLDIDESGNMYFDVPHAWNVPFEQPQVNNEVIPIDPSLVTMSGPPAPTAHGQTVITVPKQLRQLIKDYRHESYAEEDGRKTRGARKLRSGKTVGV